MLNFRLTEFCEVQHCPGRTGGEGVMIAMVDLMEDYEAGYLDPRESLELYAELIRTGQARSLSEPCGPIAPLLIEAGYITPAGNIAPEGYAAPPGMRSPRRTSACLSGSPLGPTEAEITLLAASACPRRVDVGVVLLDGVQQLQGVLLDTLFHDPPNRRTSSPPC
jgi:hypothetical protein